MVNKSINYQKKAVTTESLTENLQKYIILYNMCNIINNLVLERVLNETLGTDPGGGTGEGGLTTQTTAPR